MLPDGPRPWARPGPLALTRMLPAGPSRRMLRIASNGIVFDGACMLLAQPAGRRSKRVAATEATMMLPELRLLPIAGKSLF